jgi:hypothetical protein
MLNTWKDKRVFQRAPDHRFSGIQLRPRRRIEAR